ncbi:MAG: hypothetical protein ACE5L6_06210 [Candidatus Bathyarchaeia archaeon]
MKSANKQLSESKQKEIRKVEIERLEEEIPKLKGEKREKGMKAYRRLLSSSADQLVYFMRM